MAAKKSKKPSPPRMLKGEIKSVERRATAASRREDARRAATGTPTQRQVSAMRAAADTPQGQARRRAARNTARKSR